MTELQQRYEAETGQSIRRPPMEIKFSGNYPKLHGQSSAKLLEVHQITIDEDTPKELLDYDTTMTDGSKFYLSNGEYLQLILIGNFMIPFCTLRRCTYENVQKYVPNIGKTFDLIVKEGNW